MLPSLERVEKNVDLQRPPLNLTSPKLCPATISPPWQLTEFDLCECWLPTGSCKLLSSRAPSLSVCHLPVYARKRRRVARQFLEVTWSRCSRGQSCLTFPAMSRLSHCVTMHDWSHQPVRTDTTPLPINPPPPKNTLCVPQNLQFSQKLITISPKSQTRTYPNVSKCGNSWKLPQTFNFILLQL